MRRISSNIHMQCFVTNGAMYRLVLLQSLNLGLKKLFISVFSKPFNVSNKFMLEIISL